MALELRHHLARLEPLALLPEQFHQGGSAVHERHIVADHATHAGPQDLDRGFGPVGQPRQVHLRYGGAGQGLDVEARKHLEQRLAVDTL